jgi:hypothetical protein
MTYHLIILLTFKNSRRNTPLIGVQLRAGQKKENLPPVPNYLSCRAEQIIVTSPHTQRILVGVAARRQAMRKKNLHKIQGAKKKETEYLKI